MKKVLTIGVFDLLHLGHVMLFQKAKNFGDYLIVAVQKDEYINKFKNCSVVYDLNERLYMVNSIKYVNEVCSYTEANNIMNEIEFDIWVKGPDQNHVGFQILENWCKANNKEVITLPRTEGVSSSTLREYLKDK